VTGGRCEGDPTKSTISHIARNGRPSGRSVCRIGAPASSRTIRPPGAWFARSGPRHRRGDRRRHVRRESERRYETHDLQPAEGSARRDRRLGIAAGKGKDAGRGTKGQKARAGGSIPPWFEGGQTPLHRRIPKLRGFKNRFKVEYEVVNIGAIGALAEAGAFELEGEAKKASKSAPVTINQDILRAVGLVRTLNKPMKILGAGEISTPLFVVADAFTASAKAKIEAAGGLTSSRCPTPLAALGVTPRPKAAPVAERSPPTSLRPRRPSSQGRGSTRRLRLPAARDRDRHRRHRTRPRTPRPPRRTPPTPMPTSRSWLTRGRVRRRR
jgi:large subunit ribosomal protein L15